MTSHTPLTLFVVKKFHDYDGNKQFSGGLRSSTIFVVDMLLREGHRAKLVDAIDGNCLDRLVTENRPTRVIIEAIWITPVKMQELRKLHPGIKWTVRIHSELSFLANEGMALEWICEYQKIGVEISFNSAQTVDDFQVLGKSAYLPNYYPLRKPRPVKPVCETIDIGCFGAIRPLKNQLIQDFAAVRYAKHIGKKLVLHMNGTRSEQGGENNLKNIQALIKHSGEELKLHPWLPHDDFLELVAGMDICLQVSLSESFNITSSDSVSMGIPLIGSEAISWLPEHSQARVDSAEDIFQKMLQADKTTVAMNHAALNSYLRNTVVAWNRWLVQ